jgi:hypothetical protein
MQFLWYFVLFSVTIRIFLHYIVQFIHLSVQLSLVIVDFIFQAYQWSL